MATKSEWRPGPTVCRCCLAEGCYKDISTEYFWMGKREVYADMLSNTLNLSISYSQTKGPNSHSRLICEACISRLRDATEFKRQVEECERMFMHHLDQGSSMELEDVSEVVLDPELKLEDVKEERDVSDDEMPPADFGIGADDEDDDLDDEPLTKLATKLHQKDNDDVEDIVEISKPSKKRKATSKDKSLRIKITSKVPPKPEKKKKEKEPDDFFKSRRNAEILLQNTTLYPFRLQRAVMICVYCLDEFQNPVLFRAHVDDIHKDLNKNKRSKVALRHVTREIEYLKVDCTYLSCKICKKSLENVKEAGKHIYDVHKFYSFDLDAKIGMQPYVLPVNNDWLCAICKLKLPSLSSLGRHTSSHFLKFACDKCGKLYANASVLKYHFKTVHETSNNTCRKCWREFPTAEEKREHYKDTISCRPFACIECSDRFLSRASRQEHLERVHGYPPVKFVCPCNITFASRTGLNRHLRLKHSDVHLTCPYCSYKTESKSKLDKHIVVHTGEKKFECPVCKKAFSTKSVLTQHSWIHSDVKRFACLICCKEFNQKVSLQHHMKNHHPEIKAKC